VRDGGRVPLHVLYLTHWARVTGGTLRPGSDAGEARWLDSPGLAAAWPDFHEDTQRIAVLAGVETP
jgi:hypothetical protein